MPATIFGESLIGQISIDAWEEDELDFSRKLDSLGGESNHLTLENIRDLVEAINNKNTRIKKLIFRNQRLDNECAIELAKINSSALSALDLYNIY